MPIQNNNSDIVVDVKDVSVVFNVANEKIQSLKEYFKSYFTSFLNI